MSDVIKSIQDTIHERIKNPFAGTFLISWVLINWKLVFSVFNFDSTSSRYSRLSVIELYINTAGYYDLLIHPFWATIVAIIVYQIASHFSLAIFAFFEKRITPWVYKKVDNSKLETKENYNRIARMNSVLREENEKWEKDVRENMDDIKRLTRISDEYEILKVESQAVNLELVSVKSRIEAQSLDIAYKFAGIWKNSYKHPGMVWQSETFRITERLEYVVQKGTDPKFDGVKFRIANVKYFEEHKKLSFTKTNDGRTATIELLLVNDKLAVGFEDENVQISFERMGN